MILKSLDNMKKNGYMLYELIISFALAFSILLIIFNTSINLNKRLSELYVKNKISSKQIILNKKIGMDFINKPISSTTRTTSNKCTITYFDNSSMTVITNNIKDDKYIMINNEKILYDNSVKIGDIENCSANQINFSIKYSGDKIDYGVKIWKP